jgi:membrane-bound lytic murein transglycosylase B
VTTARIDQSAGRASRVVFRVLLVVLLFGVAAGAVWLLGFRGAPAEGPAADVVAVPVRPGASVATRGTVSGGLAGWTGRVSAATGIPAPAVRAYGNAELLLRKAEPGCHLSWNTLAGIGRVESDNGRYGGATLRADGSETTPVVGVPLDGSSGVRDVPDTDHGVLDGDPVHDRAVGPMQFLPSTWRRYADAGADPQNIDAAAVAAGRYLCAGGRDLATAAGWWSAVLSYNDSVRYGQQVFGLADSYGRA